MAIVQYFTDMAGIERLAGALFLSQHQRADNEELKEILATFVIDEMRHSRVAELLAEHYNVNKYKTYEMNPHLTKFIPHFIRAIDYLSPEVANTYITTGEIVLDVALLRSLDDFVDDHMSNQAMRLINRDESRHIAVDFHMADYYCSDEYNDKIRNRPRPPLTKRVRAWWSFANVIYYAAPFFKEVFFQPMDLTDPEGKRILEAFKWIQLVASKPRIAKRPFVRFMLTLQRLFNDPIIGAIFGRPIIRIIGVDPRVLAQLYSEAEMKRARKTSMDQLAEQTLAAKFSN